MESADSIIDISVTADGLRAYISLYPAVNDGETYTLERVMSLIAENGISVNLKTEIIKQAFEIYSEGGIIENMMFAEGIKPINGSDAQVMLNFDPVNSQPRLLSNGRVDYKNIDNIRLTRKGDLLLTKRPFTNGVKGLTVRNEEIPAEKGNDIKLVLDDGITTDEHEKEYYATVDGCVTFHNNKLGVSPYTVCPAMWTTPQATSSSTVLCI
ncbi:MAG: FapA family protein [Geovibrio sp.]|nr:FapA family protein [Geovibrio sp.]